MNRVTVRTPEEEQSRSPNERRRKREVRPKTESFSKKRHLVLLPTTPIDDGARPKTRADCFRWRVPCLECDGHGGTEEQTCSRCNGSGLEFMSLVPTAEPNGTDALVERDPVAYVTWVALNGDCVSRLKPCCFVGCKHHLFLDVNEYSGSIQSNFPDLEPDQIPETCTLDIAGGGAVTLDEVGECMNLSRERVRQIERDSCRGMRKSTAGACKKLKEFF